MDLGGGHLLPGTSEGEKAAYWESELWTDWISDNLRTRLCLLFRAVFAKCMFDVREVDWFEAQCIPEGGCPATTLSLRCWCEQAWSSSVKEV